MSAGLLILSLSVAIGCSGSGDKLGTVQGKVTINGAAANSGSVVFAATNGTTISGNIEPDGTYRAIGVPVGEAKVTVSPPAVIPGGGAGAPVAAGKDMPGTSAVAKPVPIPAKYAKAESSGLTFTVKSGTNTKDFDLASK